MRAQDVAASAVAMHHKANREFMADDSFAMAKGFELRYEAMRNGDDGLNASLYDEEDEVAGKKEGTKDIISLIDDDDDDDHDWRGHPNHMSQQSLSSSTYPFGESSQPSASNHDYDYLLHIESMIMSAGAASQSSSVVSTQVSCEELSQMSTNSVASNSSTGMSNARKLFLASISRVTNTSSTPPVDSRKGLVDISMRYSDWEVVLLVDVRERDYHSIQTRMVEKGVICEVRQLPVGDFLWVARKKAGTPAVYLASSDSESGSDSGSDSEGEGLPSSSSVRPVSGASATLLLMENAKAKQKKGGASKRKKAGASDTDDCREIVLDCIAERKTNVDLSSSIMDGRYIEQKRRLIRSGLRSKLYVVEGISMADHPKCTAVRTAVAETSTSYDMRVLRTRNLDHTISILQALYFQAAERFKAGKCFYSQIPKPGIFSSVCSGGEAAVTDMYLSWTHFKNLTAKKSASTVGELFGGPSIFSTPFISI